MQSPVEAAAIGDGACAGTSPAPALSGQPQPGPTQLLPAPGKPQPGPAQPLPASSILYRFICEARPKMAIGDSCHWYLYSNYSTSKASDAGEECHGSNNHLGSQNDPDSVYGETFKKSQVRGRPVTTRGLSAQQYQEHGPDVTSSTAIGVFVKTVRHSLRQAPYLVSDYRLRAKTWYMDGTFKKVRRPFYQVFDISMRSSWKMTTRSRSNCK
uniref:Uncharacterized protein n=1 Tax=Branchiostoma floridae TaxID=7739 RepID=C3YSX1_BRAFL|eukprot:XP_002600623.1 hypothetical protein BRAFLDRAFT_95137 [Branchiostoma floridae]